MSDNFDDIIDPNEFNEMDDFFRTNPDGFSGEGLRPVSFVLAESILMVQAWRRDEAGGGFRANLAALDQYIHFAPKELTIIAGRPGTGKTALAIQLVTDAMREPTSNERVAVFSAEMSGSMLLIRLAVALAEVDIPTLRRGDATEAQYRDVEAALRNLSDMPLWISDKSAPDYSYMRAELEDFQKDYKLVAVVFDFMELLRTRGKTNEERASMAVTALKDIAKEFNVPVIGISQLNREVEDRADKLPRMSDLRSSGMIEQLADNIVLMMRPKYYRDKGIEVDTKGLDKALGATNIEDPCYFVIAKNRNGPTGLSYCAFDAQKMSFYTVRRKPLADMLTDDPGDEQETEEA